MMAAVRAEGETTIDNSAREPEIVDLSKFLISMGADIEGAGTSTIKVRGVSELHGAEHTVIGDRIEAGTYLVAGAITGGEVEVEGISPRVLDIFLSKLRSIGVHVQENSRSIKASGDVGQYVVPISLLSVSRIRHGSAGSDHGVALCGPGAVDRD